MQCPTLKTPFQGPSRPKRCLAGRVNLWDGHAKTYIHTFGLKLIETLMRVVGKCSKARVQQQCSHSGHCGGAIDVLTDAVQFHTYGKEFALASSFGLTGGNEPFL